MKQLFGDVFGFIKSLDPIDILLYFAVVVLIVLVVSLIYIMKTSDAEEEEQEIEDSPIYNKEELDLQEVMTNLENTVSNTSEHTSYEVEQEEKAIISYEELLKKSKMGAINYDEEEKNEEISIKKINLDHLTERIEQTEEVPLKSNLFRYEKEEAFLKALQSLNELLN